MQTIDEKFKDASPVQTVERIRGILAENGLAASERWMESGVADCFSVRVTIDGTDCGSYGKGVTRELARASGYAELMERLENGLLCLRPLKRPDSLRLTKEELLERSGALLGRIAALLSEKEHTALSAGKLAEFATVLEPSDGIDCTMFYSMNEDRQLPLPQALLLQLNGSNGLAAGNSPEEALVQGFSEIQERHCQYRILSEGLTPPAVPEEILRQYGAASSVIRAMRGAGYDVSIRDCSLGEGYPVVGAVVIDRRTHRYHVHLGASPVFEIALERSLTETFQGRHLSGLALDRGFALGSGPDKDALFLSFGQGHSVYPPAFFLNSPSYPFVPFADRSALDNRGLLRFVVDFVRARGLELLVRSESYLGFDAFRLYVPGRTEMSSRSLTGEPPLLMLRQEARRIARDLRAAPAEACLRYLAYFRSIPKPDRIPPSYARISGLGLRLSKDSNACYAYLSAAYAAWKCGEAALCLDYLSRALGHYEGSERMRGYLEALQCVLELEQSGLERDKIRALVGRFYPPEAASMLLALLQAGQNPLENLLPRCTGGCEHCPLLKICVTKAQEELVAVVNRRAEHFDAAAAMAQLRALFRDAKN